MFDEIHKDVAEKTAVPEAVRALVENVALEIQGQADSLKDNASGDAKKLAGAVRDLADRLIAEAGAFGDSVMRNVELPKAPLYEPGQEMPAPPPHNETSRLLVDNGMDVATANSMTGPGSNI